LRTAQLSVEKSLTAGLLPLARIVHYPRAAPLHARNSFFGRPLAERSISMSQIASSLRQFIRENFLFGQDVALADHDSLLELGIVDSTGVLELVTFIEEHYQITVEDEELVPENLDSIENLVRFIGTKCECSSVSSVAMKDWG
jgi:acyl carrier protein